MARSFLFLSLICLAGCLDDDRKGLIRNEPFQSRSAPTSPKLAPASVEAASRVDSLGRDILQANPDLAIQPHFLTVGVPEPTIFHRGPNELYVSEGFVKRCESDGELAAALCMELGKMVAEQEMFERARPRDGRPLPSGTPRDITGASFNPDQTDIAELARYEKANPRRVTPAIPVDARNLAQELLVRARFSPDDLTAIAPLLSEAEKNHRLEQQMTRGK